MLDLKRFSTRRAMVAPVIDHWGKINGRRFQFSDTDDGWYNLFVGDYITHTGKASPLSVLKATKNLKQYRVLALGTEGIPLNFDQFFRQGYGESVSVNFLNLPIFTVANIVQWEDKRWYFYEETSTKERAIIQEVKKAFEAGQDLLELRGVTPEIRYYFLLANLQRQSLKAMEEFEHISKRGKLSDAERAKRVAEFQSTFDFRLKDTVVKAGGTFIRYSKQGANFLLEWKVGGQKIKSTIRDNLQIISAGFCLSGDDQRHSVASLVGLAQLFQEEKPLYITRD